MDLLWETPSVMVRFDGTGTVSRQDAAQLGLVGLAARASGVERDVRSDLPWGIYQSHELPSVTLQTGDVAARVYAGRFEIQKSVEFISDVTLSLAGGTRFAGRPPAGARASGGCAWKGGGERSATLP